jgi:hypothetical protein
MVMVTSRTLLLVVFCLWTFPASAQIFECTDAHGAKTFAQKCPADTVKQRQLNISTTQPGGARPPPSMEEQEAAFRQRQIEREAADTKEKEDREKRAQAAKQCPDARQKLEMLESGHRMRYPDDRGIMDDQQRATEIQQYRDFIGKWCN